MTAAEDRSRLQSFALVLMILLLIVHPVHSSDKPTLTVAISLDIPPFVTNNAGGGLEFDIVSQALEGYHLRFVQMPYRQLQTAVVQQQADVSVGVQQLDDGAFYSVDFITFANYAISKKSAGLKIDKISDLAPFRVLAWQNAYLDLGRDFAKLFAPGAPRYGNLVEVADQAQQVRRFWEGGGEVIVIDRSIFDYFSRAEGHSLDKVTLHPIFPPVTDFKVAFREAVLRDRFNEGIARMCRDGSYSRLLNRYDVKLEKTVCD